MPYKAKVFADTRKMSREEWLKSRKQGIGGSDVSAILGLNPYSSPLKVYTDKVSDDIKEETNEAMRQGTDFEQYVADRFCEETGYKVKRCNKILQHPDYPWMLANVDRLIISHDWGLECKTTSPYSKFKFDEGEINPHYYWQSMHYMAVTGASRWYVAVLVLGKSFHVFQLDRDDDAIQTIIDAEKKFWEWNVVPKNPPLPTGNDADDEALATLYPEGRAYEDEDIAEMYAYDNILTLRAMTIQKRDELDAEIKEYDQQLKLAMGERQMGISDGWKINWTNTNTSRIDTKLLKQKYPDIAREVTKFTTGRRFSVSKMKEADNG